MEQVLKKKRKRVSTQLDELPYGDSENLHVNLRPLGEIALPQNASIKRMTDDTLRFLWPTFLELLLTQLTTIVSQIMVGRIPGQEGIYALAAVGLAAQPKFLVMTMIQGVNVGVTTVIARFRGQNDQERLNRTFKLALLFNLFLSIVFMCLGLWTAEPLIGLMASKAISEETMSFAVLYFKIQLYGLIPLGLSITVTAALRGVGETRIPMIYNLLSNVINILLGYCIIYGNYGFPKMGVIGASLSIVAGQTVAFVISMWASFSGRYSVKLKLKEKFLLEKDVMADIIRIGIPNMIEQLFMRLGLMIFSRLISGLGDTMYATHQVANSVQSFAYSVGAAFTSTTAALVGQSLGKKRYDMAAVYTRITRVVALIFSGVIMIWSILFSRTIVSWFNSTPEIIELGHIIIIMIAVSLPIQTDQTATVGSLRGAGDTLFPALVTLSTVVVLRNILGVIFINIIGLGLIGAWLALLIDQCIRSGAVCVRYHQGKWKEYGRKKHKG